MGFPRFRKDYLAFWVVVFVIERSKPSHDETTYVFYLIAQSVLHRRALLRLVSKQIRDKKYPQEHLPAARNLGKATHDALFFKVSCTAAIIPF